MYFKKTLPLQPITAEIMVFSSLTFLFAFIPLCFLLHLVVKHNVFRNMILVLFSLVFYAWGEPIWIFLLLFTSFFNYGFGLEIDKRKHSKSIIPLVILAVSVNLGLLIIFKYGGFIWDNLNHLFPMPFARPTNTLPIGISFYTFQAISYLIDVKRGRVSPQRNPLYFLMYISFFPQLVAGPIVRYELVAKAIERRKIDWNDVSAGINRFCFGLLKKVLIANIAGELVAKYLDANLGSLACAEAWFGILMFSVQLYFDFSGYSDMAIGLARMFGFKLEENFRHPYAAISCGDFYRRWHISLGKFFRDYVYIPLGGNRRHHALNIFIVWSLTGIWHGANWNFLLWGMYFGIFMIIEKHLKTVLDRTPYLIRHIYTLFLTIFSWSIFYFTDFGKLKSFIINLFYSNHSTNPQFYADLWEHTFWFGLVIILCIPWDEIFPDSSRIHVRSVRFYNRLAPVTNAVILLLSTALLVGSTYNPFIYFRF